MKNVEFINAGAGSGKTYTLTQTLVNYLSRKENRFKPSEVILTTFTDMAAAEFHEKTREALLKAGLFEEASQLETASIGTVHAVSFGFVKQYWHLLGRGASDNVMSEDDRQFYINQSLAYLATNDDILFFEDLFREFGFSKYDGERRTDNPDYWKDHLKSVIDKMDQYEIEDLTPSREKSKLLVGNIFCKKSGFDETTAKKVLEKYLNICGDKSRKEKVEKLVKAKPFLYANLVDLATLVPVDRERVQLPEIDTTLAMAASEIRSQLYGEKLKNYIDRIFDLAQEWKKEFHDYKAKNRLIDYNDMERLFLRLLEKPAVIDEIKGRYKLVLVDEFQDSSPIQLKIFNRLSELVENSVWVGDPKQAIYGFRGSDALLIKGITDVFNKGDDKRNLRKGKPLNISYRSSEGLVQLANTVFERAFTNIDPKDVVLKADRNDLNDYGTKPLKALKHWHLKKDAALRNPTNTDHFQNLAHQIIELLNSNIQVYDKHLKCLRAVEPEDIVILCRTNNQVNSITENLRNYGLKTAGQSVNKSFLEKAEVKLFLAILNYVQNDHNDLAKAEILHLCNFEDYSVRNIILSRLKYLPKEEDARNRKKESENPGDIEIPRWESDNPFIKKIEALAGQVKALPVPDLAESIISRLDLRTLVSRWDDADQRVRNLDVLLNYADSYDQRCLQLGLGASLNNYIVYLNSLGDKEEKAEKVKGAVNVLTYHKAKGLEWHVVVLESLDNDELNEDELIRKSFFGVNDVVTGTPSGENLFPERYIQLLPWFSGTKEKIHADIKALIIQTPEYKIMENKVREEVKRLMYVGVTRARDCLITVSYHKANLKWLENIGCREVKPQDCEGNSLDLWNTAYTSDFYAFDKIPDFTGIQKTWNKTGIVKPVTSGNYEPRYISPSKVHEKINVKVELLKDFNHRIAVSAKKNNQGESPSDAQIGTCLHNIFCACVPNSKKNQEITGRILKNMLMQSTFPEPERITKSFDNLYAFLTDNYGAPSHVYKELPLQKLTVKEQVVRGSCDLLWETEKGCIIVDFKSFQGGIQQLTNPADNFFAGIYGPQLKTYCDVLETAGKKIIANLIYYVVSGFIIKITEQDQKN